ncbi:hypothetical protein [Streptomyces otsuchiensis]|uniref:hypothetical protein n=1 Tax=Streptomyces otsuchiensis TaxID=2681388 RepID=UPI001D131460|nr:hypothetical protein [Streptomyces otsuchiensis]
MPISVSRTGRPSRSSSTRASSVGTGALGVMPLSQLITLEWVYDVGLPAAAAI